MVDVEAGRVHPSQRAGDRRRSSGTCRRRGGGSCRRR
jgi:hypothetical protein